MKYLKNKCFQRELDNFALGDEYSVELLDDILKGRSISLGFKVYKIRSKGEGKGKSGGFRNIFFWKKNELIVFCLLFAKNNKDDLSFDEAKALRILSKEYDKLTDDEIKIRIQKENFLEIKYVEGSF